MKYIIAESKIKEILSSILNGIHIREITDGRDMVYPSGKEILGNPPMIWNKYIEAFGPLYIIKYGGNYYVAQYQKDGWFISDEGGYNISEPDLIDSLGLSKFGFSLNQLIELKNKIEFS